MKRQTRPRINRLIFSVALGGLLLGQGVVFPTDLHAAQSAPSRVGAMVEAKAFEQAAALLESQWQAAPQDTTVALQLLRLRLVLNQTEAAEAMVQQAQSQSPNSIDTLLLSAMASYGLAVDQDDPNRESQALSSLNALLTQTSPLNETNPTVLFVQGLAHSLNGNLEKAEVCYLKALHLSPNHTLALLGLSDVYLSQKQKKLAVPLLQQLLELAPNDVDTLFLMGRLYFEKENPEQALILLNQSRQADTIERPRRLLLQAECYRLLGKQPEAILAFEGVLRAWPQRADLWVKLGHLYDASGEMGKGLRAFQTAYQLQPEIIKPFITDALSTLWNETPQLAAPLLDRLPQIAPDRDDLLLLAIENHMWLSIEGMQPTQSTLQTLSESLQSRPQSDGVDLVLADIQLESLKNQGLTEGLRKTLEDLDTTSSPTASVQKALMLHQPLVAQQALNQIPAAALDEILVARIALWGLGLWSQNQVQTHADLAMWTPQLTQWTQSQTRLYRANWTNALLFVRAKQYNEARKALAIMTHHNPLSAQAQLLYAEIEAQAEAMDALDTALQNAMVLGLSTPQERETHTRLQKIADELHRRDCELAKPSSSEPPSQN